MLRLLIFAVFMLLMSAICNGQGKTSFGDNAANDTSFTVAQLKLNAYSGGADTMILIVLPNGTVKKVAKGAFSGISYTGGYGVDISGSVISVDTLEVQTALGFTPERILNVLDFGAIPNDTLDDAWAIQAAIDSAYKLKIAVIYAPRGEYLIKGDLIKYINGHPVNAQVAFPYVGRTQTSDTIEYISIVVRGEVPPASIDSYLPSLGNIPASRINTGTVFKSTINNDGSEYPAVIGVAKGEAVALGPDSIYVNHLGVKFENITVMSHYDSSLGGTQLCGIDMFRAVANMGENVRICIDTTVARSIRPQHDVFAYRGIAPFTGNIDNFKGVTALGFRTGIVTGEHTVIDATTFIQGCEYAFSITNNSHPVYFDDPLVQACPVLITAGKMEPRGNANIAGKIRVERTNVGAWTDERVDILDTLNYLHGALEHYIHDGESSPFGYDGTLSKSGGANLSDIDYIARGLKLTNSYFNANRNTFVDPTALLSTNTGLRYLLHSNAAGNTSFGLGLGSVDGSGNTSMWFQTSVNSRGWEFWNHVTKVATITSQGYFKGNYQAYSSGGNTVAVWNTSDSTLRSLTNGTNGHVLTLSGGVPTWAAPAAPYTISTGLTLTGSTVTNNLSTGVSGGQSITGGTASGNGLTINSTSNATKGTTSIDGILSINGNTQLVSVSTAGTDAFQMIGSNASRTATYLRNTTTTGQAISFWDNDRGAFAAHGAILMGNQSNVAASIFGQTRNDFLFIYAAGASVRGMGIGTQTSDPLILGTNNLERMRVKETGVINISGVSTYADNAAALAGGLVAGDIYRTSTGQLMIVF